MIKLGIIGADSFHGQAFGELCQDTNAPLGKRATIQTIWWKDQIQTKKLCKQINVSQMAQNIDAVFKNIDAVLLINRFGDERLEIVKKILKFKKPIFIDKPISTNIVEAEKIISLCNKNKIPVMSSSALRFAEDVQKFKKKIQNKRLIGGNLLVPAECNDLGDDKRLQNLSFYGVHTTELIQEIFGNNFKLNHFRDMGDIGYLAIVSNPNQVTLTINFLKNTNNFFSINAYTSDIVFNLNIDLTGSFFTKTLENFLNFLEGKNLHFTNADTLEALNLILSIENKVKRK